ncbi:MAG TPA: aminotransferase class IV [Sporichthyaceae bacterium]
MSSVWLNGRMVPVEQATVPITDHGLTVGDGVFETTKVIHGVPFARTRHLARLHDSARAIGLPLPDDDYLRAAIDAVCATVADAPLARLRLTVTAGPGPAGSARGAGPPTVWASATPTSPPSAPETAIVVPWRRNENGALTGVKTTSYAENVVALATARAAGVGEALLANTAGELCEGTGTNVFCVLDGVACTPPLRSGCLAGVTRALLLAWCPQVVERSLSLADLARAEEVFLTSATRDVHAVASVDGRRPGGPKAPVPGPVTTAIAARFAARAAEDHDP